MNSDEISTTGYLQELYNTTQGDTETQVSMYDLGLAIGIDKTEAGRIAEELMVQGYIELKTLAGGISITSDGLGFLGLTPKNESHHNEQISFSSETTATDADRTICQKVITNIQHELTSSNLDYAELEQIILDIKAIELHLLSPRPKTAVLLELFRSITHCFSGQEEVITRTGLASLNR